MSADPAEPVIICVNASSTWEARALDPEVSNVGTGSSEEKKAVCTRQVQKGRAGGQGTVSQSGAKDTRATGRRPSHTTPT
jgi:hypothetical protein